MRRIAMYILAIGSLLLVQDIHSQYNRFINSVGKPLPPDAAPPAQQVLRHMTPEPLSLDSSIFPYDTRGTILPFEPLLTRDENMQPVADMF